MSEPDEYEDEIYCDNCGCYTRQTVHYAGHERDSSHDWKLCQECGWRWNGFSGDYEPPHVDAADLYFVLTT